MSNIVSLRRCDLNRVRPGVSALVDMLSVRRRQRHDPFWLKENAELLQILAATSVEDVDLTPFEPLSANIMAELRFFPQYYRLYLSMALDLAALGMPGLPVDEMAAFILRENLSDVELSDTHRGEACLLLERAGAAQSPDEALRNRLIRFASNTRGFSLPNRRAAYDLTHIVFHATDYGRRRFELPEAVRRSLMHVGMVAWLEENMDLLAETVIALSLCSAEVPPDWSKAVLRGAVSASFLPGHEGARFDDDYHQYLVTNWAALAMGQGGFNGAIPQNARLIRCSGSRGSALRELSMVLFDMGDQRLGDWSRMRWRVLGRLSADGRDRIEALQALPEFEAFFEGFARATEDGSQK